MENVIFTQFKELFCQFTKKKKELFCQLCSVRFVLIDQKLNEPKSTVSARNAIAYTISLCPFLTKTQFRYVV